MKLGHVICYTNKQQHANLVYHVAFLKSIDYKRCLKMWDPERFKESKFCPFIYVPRFKVYISQKENRRTIKTLFACNAVRLFYILQSIFAIFYVVYVTGNNFFLFTVPLLLYILIDNIFVLFNRQGYEYKW